MSTQDLDRVQASAGASPILAAVLAGIALCLPACGDEGSNATLVGEMERIEERTESFANALLDLSVAARRRDLQELSRFFSLRVRTNGLPEPTEPTETIRWISRRSWTSSSPVTELSGAAFVAQWSTFLDRYPEIDDVRFMVKSSTVSGESITGSVKFWLVGRNRDGRREWARARAEASGRRDGEQWRLRLFVFRDFETLASAGDLFHEVAAPAGIAAGAPPGAARKDEPVAANGAAVADVDRDGFLDLFVTGAEAQHLYLGGSDGRFRDVAEEALLRQLPHTATAPLFLDFDQDGDQDLFLAAIGEQLLFENRLEPDGKLVYWDVSARSGVARHAIGFSAVAGDVNGDGFPDIYVASYNRHGEVLPDSWDGASNGTPNLLFVSDGQGGYKEEGKARGVADSRWSYAAGFADVDGDGRLDLYVANDFGGGNALYMNRGERFVDEAEERGVAAGGYGMGVSFADYDNDGDLDLHVTRMSSNAGRRILARLAGGKLPAKERLEAMASGNALYRNLGGGKFEDASAELGPFAAGWAWGGGFLDLDNDGLEDLYTPNGFISGTSLKDT
ncbi:MAG: FG-GAP repeat domain-containing protein [Myxococcota bacterium]